MSQGFEVQVRTLDTDLQEVAQQYIGSPITENTIAAFRYQAEAVLAYWLGADITKHIEIVVDVPAWDPHSTIRTEKRVIGVTLRGLTSYGKKILNQTEEKTKEN
jgi:hypothetical protein